METEIKLLLPAASRAAVEAHPLFAAAPARRVHNVSTYYDTPDLALRARGVALRVRRAGGDFVQTVKSAAGADFASRGEWEWPLPSEALDPEAVAREPAARALLGGDLGRLEPVFVTDVQRDIRVLTLDGRTTVEAAIDVGEVRAGARSQPLSELELELKGGPVGPLLRLAAALARDASLRLGPDSKSERGYALLATEPPPPHPGAAGLALPGDVALRDAFPALVAAAARDFAADLSPAARGDVEGVHRLRAAIRKLRTLFVLFAPHLAPEAAAGFDAELRDLGRVLGGGRDWDVFLTETLAGAEEHIGPASAAPLRDAAEARRARAHAAVAAAVEGPVPTALLLGLSLWTADGGWMKDGAEADAAFRDLLPGLLARLERRALKRGRHLRSLDVEELHALRKSLKKLRYACEDVASLYGRGAVHGYVAAVKKVLADLGLINDAAVTEERVADLAPADHAALAGPAAALLAWNDRRRRGSERDLRRRWRRFRNADPFWE